MRLFELTDQIKELESMIEEGEIDAEVLTDTLEGIELEWEEKAGNIIALMKNTNALIDAIDAEIAKFKRRRDVLKKNEDRLEAYLAEQILARGTDHLDVPQGRVTFRKSVGTNIADKQELLNWLIANGYIHAVNSVMTPSTTAVRDLIESGIECPYASVETRLNLQLK